MSKELQPIRIVEQEKTGQCLPACIEMALQAFGVEVTHQWLARRWGVTKSGADGDKIKRFLWANGFETLEKANMTWEELKDWRKKYQEPILVIWLDDRDYEALGREKSPPDEHACLVREFKTTLENDYIVLYDPALGQEVQLSKNYWMSHWFDGEDDRWAMAILKGGPDDSGDG